MHQRTAIKSSFFTKIFLSVIAVLAFSGIAYAKPIMVCKSKNNNTVGASIENGAVFGGIKLTYGNIKANRLMTGGCSKDPFPSFTRSGASKWTTVLMCENLYKLPTVGSNDPFPSMTNISAKLLRSENSKNYVLTVSKMSKVEVPGSDPHFPDYKNVSKIVDLLDCAPAR